MQYVEMNDEESIKEALLDFLSEVPGTSEVNKNSMTELSSRVNQYLEHLKSKIEKDQKELDVSKRSDKTEEYAYLERLKKKVNCFLLVRHILFQDKESFREIINELY